MACPEGNFGIGQVVTAGAVISVKKAGELIAGGYAVPYTENQSNDQETGSKAANKAKQVPAAGLPTEKIIRRMNKTELLAACAGSQFEIIPPEGAKNPELAELLCAKLKEIETGGPAAPGTSDPHNHEPGSLEALRAELEAMERPSLILSCTALELPAPGDDVEEKDIIETILEKRRSDDAAAAAKNPTEPELRQMDREEILKTCEKLKLKPKPDADLDAIVKIILKSYGENSASE